MKIWNAISARLRCLSRSFIAYPLLFSEGADAAHHPVPEPDKCSGGTPTHDDLNYFLPHGETSNSVDRQPKSSRLQPAPRRCHELLEKSRTCRLGFVIGDE